MKPTSYNKAYRPKRVNRSNTQFNTQYNHKKPTTKTETETKLCPFRGVFANHNHDHLTEKGLCFDCNDFGVNKNFIDVKQGQMMFVAKNELQTPTCDLRCDPSISCITLFQCDLFNLKGIPVENKEELKGMLKNMAILVFRTAEECSEMKSVVPVNQECKTATDIFFRDDVVFNLVYSRKQIKVDFMRVL